MLRFLGTALLCMCSGIASAGPVSGAGSHGARLVEPGLKLEVSATGRPTVALTFDACMGKTDLRILDVLLREHIPATLFVTARWLKHNPGTVALLKQNADLFEIENHGARHVPAVDLPVQVYGLQAAGTTSAVIAEVKGGADAIEAEGFPRPRWFRGATARYSRGAIATIRDMGYDIAGYSIGGDGGSLLGAEATRKRFLGAQDGDVIIAHINQPTHKAGEGVVSALIELKRRGFDFVLLRDRPERQQKAPAVF